MKQEDFMGDFIIDEMKIQVNLEHQKQKKITYWCTTKIFFLEKHFQFICNDVYYKTKLHCQCETSLRC